MSEENKQLEDTPEIEQTQEEFANEVEALGPEIEKAQEVTQVIEDVSKGNWEGMLDGVLSSDIFKGLGPTAAAIAAAYEGIKKVAKKITDFVENLFGFADNAEEKIDTVIDGTFNKMLRMFLTGEEVTVPALYQFLKKEAGTEEFWAAWEEGGMNGAIDYLYGLAEEGIDCITHESLAPIAAALGIKNAADLKKKKEELAKEEGEEGEEVAKAGKKKKKEKGILEQATEDGGVIVAGDGGYSGLADDKEEKKDEEKTEEELSIEEQTPWDEEYDAETEKLAENMEMIEKILFTWMRCYVKYYEGTDEDIVAYMEKCENGETLKDKEREKVGEMMAKYDVGMICEDGNYWTLVSPEGYFVIELSSDDFDKFIEAVNWPKKDIEKSKHDLKFVTAGALVMVTAAATIADYVNNRVKGREAKMYSSLKRILASPCEVIKVVSTTVSKGASKAGGKHIMGYLRKVGTKVEVYTNLGEHLEKLDFNLADAGKDAASEKTKKFEMDEETKKFKEDLEVKEQVEKLKEIDTECVKDLAEMENKKHEIRRKAIDRRIPFDDPSVKDKLLEIQTEYGQQVKDNYKRRIKFTSVMDLKDIEANKMQLDADMVATCGLKDMVPPDVPVQKNALMNSLSSLKLKGIKLLKVAKGGVVAASIVLTFFYGMRFLARSAAKNEEKFELDPDDHDAFVIDEIKNEIMQYNEEGYKEILTYATNPEKFNDLEGDEDIRLVERATEAHIHAAGEIMNIISVNYQIINNAFKKNGADENSAMRINSFLKIKYDPDREQAYLSYPDEDEFKQTCYQMIDAETGIATDIADAGRWLAEAVGVDTSEITEDDKEEYLDGVDTEGWTDEQIQDYIISQKRSEYSQLAETAIGIAPFVGTTYDLWSAGREFYRDNDNEFWSDYGWGIAGAAMDVATLGVGSAALKGGVRGGAAVVRTTKLAKAAAQFEKHGGRIFMGVLALQLGDAGCKYLGWIDSQQYEGRYYANSPEEAQDIPFLPYYMFDLEKAPEDIDNADDAILKRYYEDSIIQLRSKCMWKNMRYEIIDKDTVRIYRSTSDESITIKRHPTTDPYVQKNDGKGVWELEGLDKAYDTFPQAVALANLVNDTAEWIDKEDLDGGSDEPFEEEDGNVEFDASSVSTAKAELSWEGVKSIGKAATGYEHTVLAEDNQWLEFYQLKLGIPINWIVNVLNNWYKYK